ncbi:hypothetical protein Hdeb2414_s0174g00823191 [Helianthus debilis subsp. tardiflorus]
MHSSSGGITGDCSCFQKETPQTICQCILMLLIPFHCHMVGRPMLSLV